MSVQLADLPFQQDPRGVEGKRFHVTDQYLRFEIFERPGTDSWVVNIRHRNDPRVLVDDEAVPSRADAEDLCNETRRDYYAHKLIHENDMDTYLRDRAEELAGPDAAFLFPYVDWERYYGTAMMDYRPVHAITTGETYYEAL